MAVVSISNLLEAGVHFGHQTKRWNPKMKEYDPPRAVYRRRGPKRQLPNGA